MKNKHFNIIICLFFLSVATKANLILNCGDTLITSGNKSNFVCKDSIFEGKVFADSIYSHLNQLFEQNRLNDLRGESHKNKYILYYEAGGDMSLPACTLSYVKEQGYYSGNPWFPGPFNGVAPSQWTSLMEELCTYNATHTLVRKYGVLYGGMPNTGKTKITNDLPNQAAIVPFMQVTSGAQNYNVFTSAANYLDNLLKSEGAFIPSSTESKIITLQSIFIEGEPKQVNLPEEIIVTAKREVITRTIYTEDNNISATVFSNYINYCNSVDTSNTGLKPVIGDVFYQRIRGFLDLFGNLVNLNGNYDCNDIPATSGSAIACKNCYCNPSIILNENEKAALYLIVQYLNSYYPGANQFDCTLSGVNAAKWMHHIFPRYRAYLSANPLQSIIKYIEDVVFPTITYADLSPGPFDPEASELFRNVEFWVASASISDFQNLTNDERIKILNFIRAFYPNLSGAGFNIYRIPESEDITPSEFLAELIYHVSKNDAASFATKLATENGPTSGSNKLIYWLYKQMIDLTSIKAMNKLATLAKGGAESVKKSYNSLKDKGVIWTPNPWLWNYEHQFNYDNIGGEMVSPTTGKVNFSATLTGFGPLNTLEKVEFKDLGPFDIVPVIRGQNVSWRTDGGLFQTELECSEAEFQCNQTVFYPAISVAWFIENLQNDQIFDAAIATVEVASMFLGVGELALLFKVKNAATALKMRRIVAGFTLSAEAAHLVVPAAWATYLENQGVPPAEAAKIHAQISKITGYLALAGGAAQVGDLIIGVAKYKTVKKLINQNSDDLTKVADDVDNFINTYPEHFDGIVEAIGIGASSKAAISALPLGNRIQVMGEILDLGSDALRSTGELIPLLNNILNTPAHAARYFQIPRLAPDGTAIRAKLFQDIIDGDMIDDFVNAPELIRSWDILRIAKSGLTKDILAIEKIDDLLSVGIVESKVQAIADLKDIKCIDVAWNLSKRNPPFTSNLDVIVSKAKAIENASAPDPNLLNKLKNLTENNFYKNPEDLEQFITKGLSDANNGTYGVAGEIDEALSLVNSNKNVHLNYKAPGYPNVEIDVYNATDNIIIESKMTKSDKFKSTGLRGIGDKFELESKLPAALRNTFNELHGAIDIVSGPLLNSDRAQILYHIKSYYLTEAPAATKLGLERTNTIIVKQNGVPITPHYSNIEWTQ